VSLEPLPSRPVLAASSAGDTPRLEQLEIAVRALQARVAALESGLVAARDAGPSTSEASPKSAPASELPPPEGDAFEGLGAAPALAGRALMAVAGAYLIRALAESRLLPTRLALVLGLGYAAAWLARAGVEARRRRRGVASADMVVVALIAFPLAAEATLRFGVGVPAVALLVAAMTAGLSWAAARDGIAAGAWAATLGATGVAGLLAVTAHAIDASAATALAVGLVAYAADRGRGWTGLAWLAALSADVLVLGAALVALQPGGPPAGYSALAVPAGLIGVLALPAVYLGAFACASVFRGTRLRAFELAQGAASLTIALLLARPLGRLAGLSAPALGALAAAGTALAGTAALIHGRRSRPLEATGFAAVACVLGFAATALLVPAGGRMPVWAAAALLAAAWARGGGARRAALSLAALLAAGTAAGIHGLAVRQLAGSLPTERSSAASWAFALAAVGVAAFLREGPGGWMRTAARAGAAAAAVLVVAGGSVALVLGGDAPASDAGAVAAVRTVVIASLAIVLALLARWTSDAAAGGLMRAVLVVGAVKLILEDLPRGRALTLVIGLAAYGAALLLAPAIERRGTRTSPR
jgi:hypothetical protein